MGSVRPNTPRGFLGNTEKSSVSELRHLQSHMRRVMQSHRLNWSHLGLEAKDFFLFSQLQSMLQFQTSLTYLKCLKQIIHKQIKLMFPSPHESNCSGISWLQELCCTQPTPFTSLSIPNLLPIALPLKAMLVYFYFIWFTLSLIIFPNSRSRKNFCCVHCWKHNANFLQGRRGLTSILNDKAVLLDLLTSSNVTQDCLFKKKIVTITSCQRV